MTDSITNNISPKDRVIGLIKTLIDQVANPYNLHNLRTRKVMGISSAQAYQTKMIVDFLPQLTLRLFMQVVIIFNVCIYVG